MDYSLMKNSRTSDQNAPITPSICRNARKPASGGILTFLARSARAGRAARHLMPSVTSILLMTALLVGLSTGTGTLPDENSLPAVSDSQTAAETSAVGGPDLLPPESDYQDDLIFGRSNDIDSNIDYETGTDYELDITADSWPEFATPTVQPSPMPTYYPQMMDIKGIPQEGMSIEDFIPCQNKCYVKVREANVRELPNTDAKILLKLTMGDIVTELGKGLFWSKIETKNGITGFVLSSLITTDVVLKPTPTPKPRLRPRITPSPVGSTLTAAQKQAIIDLARSCLGIRYHYGYATPSEGFDCSGFTCYIYKTLFNITLPRSAKDQSKAGVAVRRSEIEVGDIICFDWDYPRGVCDHVGIYIGGGHYIHAAYSKGKVLESVIDFSSNPVISIRRIIH
jgi:cell wall-associated NlpC family hydrolase